MNWKLRALTLVVVGSSLGLLSGCDAKKKPDAATTPAEAPAPPAQAPSHTTDAK